MGASDLFYSIFYSWCDYKCNNCADNSGKKQYATEIVVDEVIKLHSNKAQTVEAPPAMEAVQDDGTLPF